MADHGAQFFTVRSSTFQTTVEEWLASIIVHKWSNGFSDGTRPFAEYDGHPRYVSSQGMNALAKHLAQSLPADSIYVNVRLISVMQVNQGWQAVDEKGNIYHAKALLMTPPVPQSLVLLGKLRDQLATYDREALERIAYVPCVAGLFQINGSINLPEPGALQRPDAPVSWIADNQRKGISPNAKIITVHSGRSISQELWELPETEALTFLQKELASYVATDAVIIEAELKRWRYSQPTILYPESYLMADGLSHLFFAGDAFGEARIEGAFLSGMAAGNAIIGSLT